ncbi:hypothetical protein ACFV42_37195 [Streptomyces solisilvae]|uniref:hypothetical protein n=1 Tax=Streptomyces malaysiensis TaxID=92644 RepID=UPI0036A0067E
MLSINPKMPPRLDKLETDLQAPANARSTKGGAARSKVTLSLAFNVGGLGVP